MSKQLSFSSIRFKDLKDLVPIEQTADSAIFKDWFNFDYEFQEEELVFLNELIQRNRLRVNSYTEEELKAKFIIPLLNKVDFVYEDISDWYERPIKGQIGGVDLGGVTDFMVAKGIKEPEIPYFFIQEFKPSKPSVFPEDQLLAELMVSLNLNKQTYIKGGYLVGQFWTFAVLEKLEEGGYLFHLSESFDSLKLEDVKEIYVNLKAVKQEIIARNATK